MGQTLANHSYVDLSLVGTDGNDPGNTVRCHTDLCSCCSEEQGVDRGDWFFPSGVSLQRNHVSNGVTYRDQRIDLYRGSTMPSGMYRCDVVTRSVTDPRVPVYVGLYSSGGKAIAY